MRKRKVTLKISPECQIGAHTFQIRWSPKILDIQDARGGGEYRIDLIIRLMPGRPISQTFQTLIHEVIHLADMTTLGNDSRITEVETQALSSGLAQFLLSLGINPDFSQIPEEEL